MTTRVCGLIPVPCSPIGETTTLDRETYSGTPRRLSPLLGIIALPGYEVVWVVKAPESVV